jgi:hypothetical protein
MKSFIQTLLIGGGAFGLFISVPFAGFCWIMWRGFSGDAKELPAILAAPLVCMVALVAGVLWKRAGQRRDDLGENENDSGNAKPNSTSREA